MSAPLEPARQAHRLSVVIATRNRAQLLRLCLESLDRQTAAPEDYEVVVVVDGSSDGTAEMLDRLEPRHELTVVEQPHSGASAGRNAGAARARGTVLLFLDDDEVAGEDLVSAHLEAHRTQERIVVIGAIERRVPERADRYARLSAVDAAWRIEQLKLRAPTFWDCFGGNCSLTRATFEESGGYDAERESESDTELAYRLHALGCEFVFEPGAVVSEYRTRPWRGIVADTTRRGRVAVDLYRRHPEMIALMPLGGSGELSLARSTQAIAGAMLALRVPPDVLATAGFLVPGRSWSQAWFASTLRHAYWCGVRGAASPDLWRQLRGGTLILGYHAFGAEGEKPSRYVVPGRRFERQLAWLEHHRYNVISLGEYIEYRTAFRLPPARTVVITIDDVYEDTVTVAGPILERFGFVATVFPISAAGAHNDQATEPALAGRPLIGAGAAHDLLAGPFEIGSHTRTHRDLTRIPASEARAEIAGSKQELERALGVQVTAFAYPFGASNPEVRSLVEEAGFLAARGIQPGRNRPATDSFDLRWLEICGTYTLARFAATLRLGDLRR